MFFGLVSCFVSSVVIVFFSLFCEALCRTLLSCWKFLRTRKKRRKRLQNRGEMSGGAGGGAVGSAKTPADFLKSIRGRPVVVKLNSGVDYRGMLYAPVFFIAIFCVFPLVSVTPIFIFSIFLFSFRIALFASRMSSQRFVD